MSGARVVVDTAGGDIGGAARWRAELDAYLARHPAPPRVLGRGRQVTPRWLVEREWQVGAADLAVASNNVSFGVAGRHRVVLLRNALHFLHPGEAHLARVMPRAFRAQIPVVRRLAGRADELVVPSTAMADRVRRCLPRVAGRVVVHAHPVTPVGPRLPAEVPFLLVPVVPGPYKNLFPRLRELLLVLDAMGRPDRIWVTARPEQLPPDLLAQPRIRPLGSLPHIALATLWRTATAAFYPSALESFGYPLAEARVYGVPVIAADTAQNREIAGAALRGYRLGVDGDLREAVLRCAEPAAAEPAAFDPDAYFDRLLRVRPAPGAAVTRGAR
ncbi:glycosyltransferase [Phytohabitans sp. ZYX-F-186]|uniref:Glycosyltransferase n=1 Tax=Phytohabitans maris TaxID=3071409 RepID=A0ABU0ZMF1_9ACTN|nr:glycosyltransferase [Phytohabitans sp. ZYX-F-186]MDQ7908209.1 glycosyltransferase [Phytohabitans sp. ZYX-F-186]